MIKRMILIMIVCFALWGCNQSNIVKGEFDIKGKIVEMDASGKRLLIEAEKDGLVWITLNERDMMNNYELGQSIVVWVDGGLEESYPAQGKALNIEITESDN